MDAARLCAELVRIRSENPPGDTVGVIEYIHGYLEGLGIPGEIVSRDPRKWNLVSLPRPGGLLFCGHVDTVPALPDRWTHPPFDGDIAEGFVWGRGSSDMKGGCASILKALTLLVNEGREPEVNIAFVCDEETGGKNGIRYLIDKDRIRPCDCLIAEPTPLLHPTVGQKGLCRVSLQFEGIPAHGSLYPLAGRSAIMESLFLIERIREIHRRDFTVRGPLGDLIEHSSRVLEEELGIPNAEEVLRRVTFNPGVIRGGEKANVVAESCYLELDMRIPWGFSVGELAAEIRAAAPHAHLSVADCAEPNYTSPQSSIVGLLCREIEKVLGQEASPIVQWAASDAKHLRDIGCRVVEYGPGDIKTLHGIDERVAVTSLESAARVYAGLVRSYRPS